MIITLTQDDLKEMPLALRRELWRFIAKQSGADASRDAVAEQEAPDFEFTGPPRGARHPTKKLISLRFDQAKEFVRLCLKREDGEDLIKVLGEIVGHPSEMPTDIEPSDIARRLDLKDKHGETDARLVSPYLKKITHAFREYTGDPEAGWYTLDRAGDFWLDPKTQDHLRRVIFVGFYSVPDQVTE